MSTLITRIDKGLYPNFARNWDHQMFRQRILAYLRPESVVLILARRRHHYPDGLSRLRGTNLRSGSGPAAVENPMLIEGRIANADKIPFESDRFDVVFSDNVLEHLDEPEAVFREVARVLKPGGVFLFKTPNKRHYMPTIARPTPHSFHKYVNRRRGRAEVDTFPTRYRANARPDIVRLADKSGLSVERIELIEGRPEYLRMTWLTYLLGVVYERLVNSTELLATFRILLIGVLRKPEGRK